MRRAIVFVNGLLSEEELAFCNTQLCDGDFLIAVDGGLRHCLALQRCPNLLVGDLDSVCTYCGAERLQALQDQGMKVERHPTEKDVSDLELALWAALERGIPTICIVAVAGGRIDMGFSHLLLLAHPRLQHCMVQLWQGRQKLWLLTAKPSLDKPGAKTSVINGAEGDGVSLLALSSQVHGVQTHGLRYALQGEALFLGSTRGLSNQMLEAQASVSVGSGMLVIVHTLSANPCRG